MPNPRDLNPDTQKPKYRALTSRDQKIANPDPDPKIKNPDLESPGSGFKLSGFIIIIYLLSYTT